MSRRKIKPLREFISDPDFLLNDGTADKLSIRHNGMEVWGTHDFIVRCEHASAKNIGALLVTFEPDVRPSRDS